MTTQLTFRHCRDGGSPIVAVFAYGRDHRMDKLILLGHVAVTAAAWKKEQYYAS
ncbi:MAG: hypothetical protein Q8Q12_11615 [bacterium]|jgi:hypothetical protein|nr:hypothetical protein [bacterium]